jgi:hypothetical protein
MRCNALAASCLFHMMAQREATINARARGAVNPCITRNVGRNMRAFGKNFIGAERQARRSFERERGAARDSIEPGTEQFMKLGVIRGWPIPSISRKNWGQTGPTLISIAEKMENVRPVRFPSDSYAAETDCLLRSSAGRRRFRSA